MPTNTYLFHVSYGCIDVDPFVTLSHNEKDFLILPYFDFRQATPKFVWHLYHYFAVSCVWCVVTMSLHMLHRTYRSTYYYYFFSDFEYFSIRRSSVVVWYFLCFIAKWNEGCVKFLQKLWVFILRFLLTLFLFFPLAPSFAY